jgi:hypothetical protein
MTNNWIPIQEAMPKPRQRVYLVCETKRHDGSISRFQTIAEYIPYMTVKADEYMNDEYSEYFDYNGDDDTFYTPEGFYEWQSEADIHYKISEKVTHWMPLIPLP